jgi:hypothetical protein
LSVGSTAEKDISQKGNWSVGSAAVKYVDQKEKQKQKGFWPDMKVFSWISSSKICCSGKTNNRKDFSYRKVVSRINRYKFVGLN